MNYAKEDLEKAIVTIFSMIERSKKIYHKFHKGTSQYSLVRNRIDALNVSITLINKILSNETEKVNYTLDELLMP